MVPEFLLAFAADKAWPRQARLSGVPELAGPPAIVYHLPVAAGPGRPLNGVLVCSI